MIIVRRDNRRLRTHRGRGNPAWAGPGLRRRLLLVDDQFEAPPEPETPAPPGARMLVRGGQAARRIVGGSARELVRGGQQRRKIQGE
jgi:hypothetical protein